MRDIELEHPDITAALMTGYPRRKTVSYNCDGCGEPLLEQEWFVDIGGSRYCNVCVEAMKQEPNEAIIEQDEEPDWFDERRRKLDV